MTVPVMIKHPPPQRRTSSFPSTIDDLLQPLPFTGHAPFALTNKGQQLLQQINSLERFLTQHFTGISVSKYQIFRKYLWIQKKIDGINQHLDGFVL